MNRLIHPLAAIAIASQSFAQATTTPSSAERPPVTARDRFEPRPDDWWQHAVFYEVFVRSFADSKGGPLADDGIGDLRGLIERLDYLNDGDPRTDSDLGVTALWLMPITDSPTYHGYDTTDYRTVEPDYGTNQDFEDLIAACEARGMRVIVDLVLNHCSDRHPWFQASRDPASDKRVWFIWRDDDPGYTGPWGQPVWHRAGDDFYYGLFWRRMPDLNYEHAPVTEQMLDVTRFWLEDMGVHGFRLDAIRHLIEDGEQQDNTRATHDWLRRFYRHCKAINPEVLAVGEIWAESEVVSTYVGNEMDLASEFSLADAIVRSVNDSDPSALTARLKNVLSLYPDGMYATFLRNHDQNRVMSEFAGSRDRAALAAAMLFCLPGVPFVYYGEEIGMSGAKPDPQIRTPLQWTDGEHAGFSTAEPWISPKPDFREVNIEAQQEDAGSLLALYKRLIRVRLSERAMRTGTVSILECEHPALLTLLREQGDETLLCLINLGGEPLVEPAITVPPRIRERVPCEELLHSLSVTRSSSTPLERLPARTGAIIRLEAVR